MANALPRYVLTGRGIEVARHLPSFVRLFWRLFRDRRVTRLPKALLVLVAVYLISPFDVVPDFIPIVGAMDDFVVALVGLWLFVRLCPPAVVREHVARIADESRSRATVQARARHGTRG